MTLDAAQEAKKHHIAKKLLIEPGMRVLDIGCGWGGMGLTLARDYGARGHRRDAVARTARAWPTGARRRPGWRPLHVPAYGLPRRRPAFRPDRVGRHVRTCRRAHYEEYFRNVRDRLSEDGIALIHTIGRASPPGTTSPWIPSTSFPAVTCRRCPRRCRISRTAIHVRHRPRGVAPALRRNAQPLACRFMANIDKRGRFTTTRFCRMWRYYLIACELTFRLNIRWSSSSS